MAVDYITVAELKNWLTPNLAATDLSLDAAMNAAITATSRLVDDYCGRRFYSTAVDETRYFSASDATLLMERDLGLDVLSITTLATDADGNRVYENTWATTDYDLEPVNAALDTRPYTRIRTTPQGSYGFPVGVAKGIKIVGRFGYCTLANLPAWAPQVRTACLMQAARLFERHVTPTGVAAGGPFGEFRLPSRLDADVALLLSPLVREAGY